MKEPRTEPRPAGAPPDEPPPDEAPPDEAKKRILARRATFVAAALAGVSTACGKEPAQAVPCLSPPPPLVIDASPAPCLTPLPPPEVTAPDAGGPAPAPGLSAREPSADAGKPKPPPRPCLKVAPPGGQ